MLLDEDTRETLIASTKSYLESVKIPFRFIKIRSGHPIVIVDRDTLYDIVDRSLIGRPIEGRYLAQGERGWIVYVESEDVSRKDFSEKLSEVSATRYALGEDIGRTPKRGRYAMT